MHKSHGSVKRASASREYLIQKLSSSRSCSKRNFHANESVNYGINNKNRISINIYIYLASSSTYLPLFPYLSHNQSLKNKKQSALKKNKNTSITQNKNKKFTFFVLRELTFLKA